MTRPNHAMWRSMTKYSSPAGVQPDGEQAEVACGRRRGRQHLGSACSLGSTGVHAAGHAGAELAVILSSLTVRPHPHLPHAAGDGVDPGRISGLKVLPDPQQLHIIPGGVRVVAFDTCHCPGSTGFAISFSEGSTYLVPTDACFDCQQAIDGAVGALRVLEADLMERRLEMRLVRCVQGAREAEARAQAGWCFVPPFRYRPLRSSLLIPPPHPSHSSSHPSPCCHPQRGGGRHARQQGGGQGAHGAAHQRAVRQPAHHQHAGHHRVRGAGGAACRVALWAAGANAGTSLRCCAAGQSPDLVSPICPPAPLCSPPQRAQPRRDRHGGALPQRPHQRGGAAGGGPRPGAGLPAEGGVRVRGALPALWAGEGPSQQPSLGQADKR